MKHGSRIPLFLSFFLLSVGSSSAQNADSVKAYILEFIKPDINIVISYNSQDLVPEYKKQTPQHDKTEAFIAENIEKYEKTKDVMSLIQIGQTYKRMNRRTEAIPWLVLAQNELLSMTETHPDSVELIEIAVGFFMEIGNYEKAVEYAQLMSKLSPKSDPLFMEAMLYSFTGQYEQGLEKSIKGSELYPEEGKWFISRILNESQQKMQKINIFSDEFVLEENRIDYSYLLDAYKKNPDNSELELISVFGEFLIFSYDEVYPSMYKRIAEIDDIKDFSFDFNEKITARLDEFQTRLIKLSKKKAYKNWHPIYYTLGTVQMFKGDYKSAIPNLKKAIKLMKPEYRSTNNNASNSYNNLIAIYTILDEMETVEKLVIQQATEEVNIDPVASNFINMGLYRIIDNDHKAGLELLDQAIAIDSTSFDAYTYKAFVSMLNNNFDEAIELLEVPQANDPEDVESFKAIVIYNLLTNNADFAKELVNRLEAYDPTDNFIVDVRRLLKTE